MLVSVLSWGAGQCSGQGHRLWSQGAQGLTLPWNSSVSCRPHLLLGHRKSSSPVSLFYSSPPRTENRAQAACQLQDPRGSAACTLPKADDADPTLMALSACSHRALSVLPPSVLTSAGQDGGGHLLCFPFLASINTACEQLRVAGATSRGVKFSRILSLHHTAALRGDRC